MVENKVRDPLLDAVKGILILCIVLEHNNLLTNNYDWIRPFCDAFAAGCFLIFTFTWPIKRLPLVQYLDKYFAYYWPYIILLTATTILNYIIFRHSSLNETLFDFFQALVVASPDTIKDSSGFMYLWFLPTLCFLYLIRYFTYGHTKISFLIAVIIWLSIGAINDDVLTSFPFSFHVIAFIFILGLIYQELHQKLINDNNYTKVFCLISFFLCSIASYFIGWELFLAGGIIPSWQDPLLLLYYSYFMLIAIPSIYHLLSFMPALINKVFIYLGKNSLLTYLIHPLIFIAFTKVFPIIEQPLFSFILTIIICLLTALFLEKMPYINSLIFPKKISNLIPSRKS